MVAWLTTTGVWIEFIYTFYNHSWSQSITTAHNKWLPKDWLHSDWTTTGSTTNDFWHTTGFILIWTASYIRSALVSKEKFVNRSYPWKCVPVSFQESISAETCLSTRFLATGLHVTILRSHMWAACWTKRAPAIH
jgi:hypothetical protein